MSDECGHCADFHAGWGCCYCTARHADDCKENGEMNSCTCKGVAKW